ncbi:RNA-binding protein CP31B [Colletotrichum trifolii]|uniref:RNA-binding protein CP31B n=1 Tax=Colletotrichum trifolii TaxID=5466 RepID=A0A4R8RFA7_COLTR|nr:RNA-binding protein CP31B [Colletotrichum trifolii]
MDAQRPASQKLPSGLAGVLNPEEHRDSAYFSSTDASSKHNSAASNVLSPTGSGYQSSLADKTPSPVSTNLVPQSLVSPAQSNMSVASMVSPTTPGSADPRRFERPISLDSGPQLMAHDHMAAGSRRESVDSRINQGFHEMRLGGNSPYASHNQSTTSIQNTLNQQRNPRTGLDNISVHRISNGYQPSNDRNPDPHPKITRTAPAITGPATSHIARAAEPTKGQAWAFPEEEIQRIGPHDGYLDSRRSSIAESMASSQFTTESRLPPGQRRLDEPTDFNNRLSSASSEFPPVHHHSLQHKQIGDLRDDDAASRTGSQPYSRTPELRKSHKLAERKRRTEMKELFDQLRDLMPQERGSKASKWEILTKAISEHQRMADMVRMVQTQNTSLAQENDGLRQDSHNLRVDIQRLQNELHNARSQQSTTGQAPPQAQVAPPPPPQAAYQLDPYANRRELPPIRGLNGSMANGPDSMTGVQYEAPRMNGYRPGERQSIRRAATRASLTSTRSIVATAAPKTQSIAFAVRSSDIFSRCFSNAVPRAFFQTTVVREEQQFQQAESDKGAEVPPPSQHVIFVQNYPFNVTKEEFREAFAKYGDIVEIQRPLGKTFCFVYYTTAEAARAAIEGTDSTYWQNRRLVVKPSEPRSRRTREGAARLDGKPKGFYDGPPTNTIYIGNIPFDATDAELNDIFAKFGDTADVRVAVDRTTGYPRGFAHADFKTPQAAQAGMDAISGIELKGRAIRTAFAAPQKREREPRDDRFRRRQIDEEKGNQTMDWNA